MLWSHSHITGSFKRHLSDKISAGKTKFSVFQVLVHKKDRAQNYDPGRTPYTVYIIFPVTASSINCSKTHKSRLKHEIKRDLYKIAQK